MRGKIPWFVPPPDAEDGGVDDAVKEGREGRLGEMPKKRKRDDESMLDTSIGETSTVAAAEESASQPKVNESFEGFDESDSQPDMEEQKDLQHTTIAKPAEESLNGDNEDEIALEDTSEDDSQGDMVEEDSEDDDDKDEGDDSDDSIDLDLQGLADEILNSSDDGDSGHADVPAPTRKST